MIVIIEIVAIVTIGRIGFIINIVQFRKKSRTGQFFRVELFGGIAATNTRNGNSRYSKNPRRTETAAIINTSNCSHAQTSARPDGENTVFFALRAALSLNGLNTRQSAVYPLFVNLAGVIDKNVANKGIFSPF